MTNLPIPSILIPNHHLQQKNPSVHLRTKGSIFRGTTSLRQRFSLALLTFDGRWADQSCAVTGLPVPVYSPKWISSVNKPGDFRGRATEDGFQPVAILSLAAPIPPTPPGSVVFNC